MLNQRHSFLRGKLRYGDIHFRISEIEADVIFKATMADGVYDKDPNKYSDAVKYDTVTCSEVLAKNLGVMDSTTASMCKDNGIPILVFNLKKPQNIVDAVKGVLLGFPI